MKRIALATAAAAAALILAGCGSSSKSTPSTPAAGPSTTAAASSSTDAGSSTGAITISGFAYSGTLTVKAGAKVTVTNNDSTAHTLTDKATKKFDTGNIPGNGGTGSFIAPTKPGTYNFGCTLHPSMGGTLTVTA